MSHFIVKALDATDGDVLARRKATRPAHIERIKPYVDNKTLIFAGAYLNDEGNPIGSVLVLDMDSRETVAKWMQEDPYVSEGIWDQIQIDEIRTAVQDGKVVA